MSKLGLYSNKKIQLVDLDENEGSVVLKAIPTTIVNQLAGSLSKYIPEEKRHLSYNKIYQQTQQNVAKYLAEKE